ncbi:MAG: DUF45 domain-containing protein [Candidatus Peribacteraceae bacterium]|nr:DUF45 domain-containing protein [Candidatus Peribacteraceae bacterium]
MHRPSHRIERSANRTSRGLLEGETIVIRLACGLSAREERAHIESLLRRMGKLLLRERGKTVIDPFRPLLEGETSLRLRLASGREYTVDLLSGNKTRAKRTEDGWRIDVGPGLHRRTLHRLLWRLLGERKITELRRAVEAVNAETLRVPIRSVRTAFASSQWGSCSARGDIMLNTCLLFLPPPLLRYVIVHELAHRKVRNHSRAYWKEVERTYPVFEDARRMLRQYRLHPL